MVADLTPDSDAIQVLAFIQVRLKILLIICICCINSSHKVVDISQILNGLNLGRWRPNNRYRPSTIEI